MRNVAGHVIQKLIVLAIVLAIGMPFATAIDLPTRTVRAEAAEVATIQQPPRPNVVLIVSDDQRADALWVMPAVRRLIGDHGVTFSNALVTNPFCCPSRATILTGRYSHSTRVYSNEGDVGGWHAFAAHGAERNTIATALDRAGYRTGLFGKYLNGYDNAPDGYVPPGWDRWFSFAGNNGAYFDWRAFDDRRGLLRFGHDPGDYSTDVIASKAVRFIRGTAAGRPLFLMVTPYGPHDPWTPAPRHQHAFDGAQVDLGPGFSEDVSDKPPYIRRRALSGAAAMRERTRAEWETLRSVDELVARVFAALAATGRVQNTLVIFLSDHGISNGQHRWQHKLTPYEESIHIPMLVRYDAGGTLRGATSAALAANVDVAPTILDFTGTSLPGVEGRSLRSVLAGAAPNVRDMLLLEHSRALGIDVPPYCGLRTRRYTFARYAGGFLELYDLSTDPYELENVARSPAYAATVAWLDRELRARCLPPPPGFVFPYSSPVR